MCTTLADTITTIVMCADNTCLCKVVNKNIYAIYETAPTSGWLQQALRSLKQICGLDGIDLILHRWFKIRVPSSKNPGDISNVIYKTIISVDQKQKCKLWNGYSWITQAELIQHYESNTLCNHIITDFFPLLKKIDYVQVLEQCWVEGVIVEIISTSLFHGSTTSKAILKSSSITSVQGEFFKDFYTFAQPNVFMALDQFVKFMNKFGVIGKWVPLMYKAVDINNLGFLTCRDVSKVIALTDPDTEHTGLFAEQRKRMLFRMFDEDCDLYLTRLNLEAIIDLIRVPTDPDPRTCFGMMKFNTSIKKMGYEEFSKNIDSILFQSLTKCLRAKRTSNSIYSGERRSLNISEHVIELTRDKRHGGSVVVQEKDRKFVMSSYTIRLVKSGTIINVEDIWGLKNVCSFETLRLAGITKELRRSSVEINSPSLIYNDQVTHLRYLVFLNKIRSANRVVRLDEFDWGCTSEAIFGQRLIQICMTTKKIVSEERRLLEIKAPIYIVGAIHGNFGDLAAFEKLLWPRSPGHSPGNILFLGGYVDRVPYGVEVVTYLFCNKNLYPKKFYLLRGSHEIRKIQQKDIFQVECFKKFGGQLGVQVYDAINMVFDNLPIAAVVDDKLLCVYSGIPQPVVCSLAKFINNIPCPLTDVEKFSELAWEIFWNEPEKGESAFNENLGIEGFLKNTKRGTGFTFNHDALNKFLGTNFYTHLIRTSEPVINGYFFSNKGRVITIFSSSCYNNYKNEGGCLYVDSGTMRVIRIGL